MVNKSLGLTWIGLDQSIDKDVPQRIPIVGKELIELPQLA
jgi:hypothetical protein